jgi:glycosyltransferase involved in cell wall biosynthesis
METTWERANEWEVKWWGNCVNTADEEAKQVYYAEQMGIPKWQANTVGTVYDLHGKSVLDIGGGPVSLLLRCINRGRSVIVDPGHYPQWVQQRYSATNIEYFLKKAEDIYFDMVFDEVWIYNVLQHVEDPALVIQLAKEFGKVVRVFEWIDTEVNIGHPHCLTQQFLEKNFKTYGKVIKSPWGPATAEKAWVGVTGETMDEKLRFHLLGLAHTKTTKDFVMCAYTQKVYKLARMLTDLGHEVIHYGAEGSDIPCEHVTVITDDVWKEAYGSYDWRKEFFKHDPNDLAYTTFNANATREINARKKPGDFLLISFGNYQKPISDAVKIPFTVEMGIGYTGVYTSYRIFESYAWMHYIYGLIRQGDGSWYDAVIPNYFDPNDFTLGKQDGGYIAYLGRLISRKGVAIGAQVAERVGIPLYCAGQGTLADLELKEGPYLKHVGSVNTEERSAFLGGAKALFVPTYYMEPFGGVAIEANLCGTPVITTDWGVFTETVLHGQTGYRCRTFDDFIWATKNLDLLWTNEQLRDHAIKNYSMEHASKMYNEYFHKVYDIRTEGWYKLHPERADLSWLRRSY